MPVSVFRVKPTTDEGYRAGSAGAAQLSGTNEDENFADMQALLAQLGDVASHATAMFQSLYNETVSTTERVERLTERSQQLFNGSLAYIENRVVDREDPIVLYKEPGKPIPAAAEGGEEKDFFKPESMPSGLRARLEGQMDAGIDFSAFDQLTEGHGAEEFKAAHLSYSNPNAFMEMYLHDLMEQAARARQLKFLLRGDFLPL